MTEYFIVYDLATGTPRWRGSGPVGNAAAQVLEDGLAIVVVPQAVIVGAEIDMTLMRQAMQLSIDARAEIVRQHYLTPGSGQALTYQRKEAEARGWIADATAATPFLNGEAAARGMTISDLAAEVVAQADAWILIGSAIEGKRMGAKAAVAAAETFGNIVSAADIDWGGLDG